MSIGETERESQTTSRVSALFVGLGLGFVVLVAYLFVGPPLGHRPSQASPQAEMASKGYTSDYPSTLTEQRYFSLSRTQELASKYANSSIMGPLEQVSFDLAASKAERQGQCLTFVGPKDAKGTFFARKWSAFDIAQVGSEMVECA